MAGFIVRDDRGRTIVDVAPNTLYRFLGECEGYVELRRDDWPDRYAIARPLAPDTGADRVGSQVAAVAGTWQIDLVDGERRLRARTPNADATLDVLRAWVEEDDWWAEAFSWNPVEDSGQV